MGGTITNGSTDRTSGSMLHYRVSFSAPLPPSKDDFISVSKYYITNCNLHGELPDLSFLTPYRTLLYTPLPSASYSKILQRAIITTSGMRHTKDVSRKEIQYIIQLLGGCFTSHLQRNVSTHVISDDASSDKCLKAACWRASGNNAYVHIVTPLWLLESYRQGRKVEEEPFSLVYYSKATAKRPAEADLTRKAASPPRKDTSDVSHESNRKQAGPENVAFIYDYENSMTPEHVGPHFSSFSKSLTTGIAAMASLEEPPSACDPINKGNAFILSHPTAVEPIIPTLDRGFDDNACASADSDICCSLPLGQLNCLNEHIAEVAVAPQLFSPDQDSSERGSQTLNPTLYRFLLSGSSEDEDVLLHSICTLGGTVVQGIGGKSSSRHSYDASCTHLIIAAPLKRTEKLLCGLAAGKWILHPDYILQSLRVGFFLDEESFEWGNASRPAQLDIYPSLWSGSMRRSRTQSLLPFQSLRVLVCKEGIDTKLYDLLAHLVQAGDGALVEAPNFPSLSAFTKKKLSNLGPLQIIISDGKSDSNESIRSDVSAFLKEQRVLLLTPTRFMDIITTEEGLSTLTSSEFGSKNVDENCIAPSKRRR